jgi:hypothetical protein
VSIAKSNGAVTQVWNPENPTAEITGQGAYLRILSTADFEANDYLAYAQYIGAEVVDSIYSYGAVGGDSLAAEAITDIAALNNLSAQQVWEYAARTLTAFGFSASISEATAQTIADEVLKRGAAHVEDEAEELSLTELILGAFESERDNTDWEIRKSDGTPFNTRTLELDADADAVVGVD